MERKDLLKNLDNRILNQLYLVYGRESLMVDEVFEKFKTFPNPAMIDFNLNIIDGSQTNLEEFRSSVETLPFMDEKRYVIIKDFELLKGKRKNFTESDEKEVIEILKNLASTTVLLFINNEIIDKKKSIYKSINKLGIVCEMKKLDDITLLNWCKSQFGTKNIRISNSDITFFIETTGYKDRNSEMTLNDIKMEIDKICSYVGDDHVVTKDIILTMMKSKTENDIFQLIEMIGNKNAVRSIKIFRDMMDNGESVLGVFAMLSKQFNQIIQIKYLQEDKMPPNLIRDTLKLHPYVFNKISRQAKNYDEKSILSILNYISDSDYKIKKGLISDNLAAEILIAKYCI